VGLRGERFMPRQAFLFEEGFIFEERFIFDDKTFLSDKRWNLPSGIPGKTRQACRVEACGFIHILMNGA
jgi:hypothetical protein